MDANTELTEALLKLQKEHARLVAENELKDQLILARKTQVDDLKAQLKRYEDANYMPDKWKTAYEDAYGIRPE